MAAADIIRMVLRVKDEGSQTFKDNAAAAGEADDAMDGAEGSAAAFSSTLLAAVGVITAAATTMYSLADANSQYVDQTIITARQLGLTTDTVIALDAALGASGSSLSENSMALRSFVGLVQDAATGSKEAADKFARLGFGSDEVAAGMSDLDSFLPAVIDRIGEVSNQSERAAAAVDVFGSRGAGLVAALDGSSASLERWGDAAAEAGLVIGGEAVAASTAMDEAQTELDIALKAITQTLGTAYTPAVAGSVEALAELIVKLNRAAPLLMEIGDWVQLLVAPMTELVGVLWDLSPAVQAVTWALEEAGRISEEMEAGNAEVEAFAHTLEDIGAGAARTQVDLEKLGRTVEDVAHVLADGAEDFWDFSGVLAGAGDSGDGKGLAKGLSDAEKEAAALVRTITGLGGTATPSVEELTQGLGEAWVAGLISDEVFGELTDTLNLFAMAVDEAERAAEMAAEMAAAAAEFEAAFAPLPQATAWVEELHRQLGRAVRQHGDGPGPLGVACCGRARARPSVRGRRHPGRRVQPAAAGACRHAR